MKSKNRRWASLNRTFIILYIIIFRYSYYVIYYYYYYYIILLFIILPSLLLKANSKRVEYAKMRTIVLRNSVLLNFRLSEIRQYQQILINIWAIHSRCL